MRANQLRGTPGLLLLGMALAMTLIALRGWILRTQGNPMAPQPLAAPAAR